MKIEKSKISLKDAAIISGFAETDIRALVNRERLFPEMQRRHGKVLGFNIQQLFVMAVVKALIGVGLPIRAACDAIRGQQVYGPVLRGTEISFAVGKKGLIGISGEHIAVSIVIRPWALFESMKTGLIEIYGPEAVAELEQLMKAKPAPEKPRKKGAA